MDLIGMKAYYWQPLGKELKESKVVSCREFFNLAGEKATLLKMDNGDEEHARSCYFDEPVAKAVNGTDSLKHMVRDYIVPELQKLAAEKAAVKEQQSPVVGFMTPGKPFSMIYEADLNRKIFRHAMAGGFAACFFLWLVAGSFAHLAAKFGWF